jgi:hypothetical protein
VEERRGAYSVLVEERREGKRPLGGPRCRWGDNIKMGLQEVRCGGMDWIDLVQNTERRRASVNEVMNLRVSSDAWNFLTSCGPVSFLGRTLLLGVSYLVS